MKINFSRTFDITITLIILFSTCPLIILLSLSNLLILGRPIFFIQQRVGYKEKIFNIIKFRTMQNFNDPSIPDEKKITRYGTLIRTLSLDELPTLINVLKGDMRLVGPRPLLPEYLNIYTDEQKNRHNVPPGITGWAQINGRNAISWEEKFDMDVWYVNNQNIFLDIKILLKTISVLIKAKNINHKGHVSMPKFGEVDK